MASFHVRKDKCVQCGACALGCPRLVIQEDSEGYPVVLDEDEYYCMRCTHCVINCAYGAAVFDSFETKKAEDLSSIPFPSPEASRRLLCTRRSVRKFKSDKVPRETLLKILDIARYAASASNRQLVRWVVLKGEALAALKQYYLEEIQKDPSEKAEQRYSRQEEQQKQGLDPIFRGAPLLVAAVVPNDMEWKEDAAIALTYLELAAHAHGVGTMWSSFVMRFARTNRRSRELLGVKEDEWVGGVILLGFDCLPQTTLLPDKKALDLTILE